MISYTKVIPVENNDRNSQPVEKKDKRFLIRQQLYYLFHAFRCTRLACTTGRGDCQNQHCIMMRSVVKHINKCQVGKECTFQHCPSSKEIIKHWKNCNDVECQVCAPLRRNTSIKKADKVGNGIIRVYEPLSQVKELNDFNWRSTLFRIRPNFLVKLTDELLPVKVCEDVKHHPGYSEVNNYVKGFEIDIFQTAQNLNDYFYKLAEKFEFVYRNLLSRYTLKENETSFEITNKSIESFFQLIKLQFETFYHGLASKKDDLKFKTEEISIKDEILVKIEEHLEKFEPENNVTTPLSSEVCSSIKQVPSVASSNSAILTPSKVISSIPPTNESKMSPDSTSVSQKEVVPGAVTWTKKELTHMFLPIHQELFDDKDSEPFKYAVNWEILEIPDYPTIVKHPMDLSTIKDKLVNGAFQDPWEVVDDFWLMFNNAWLYNKKTSKVSKMCNTLAKIFESKVDDVMVSCGFCCGREYVYLPQVLICCTSNVCLIVRDTIYYAFQNDKSNGEKNITDLTCDRYLCCEKCYNDSMEEIHFINPENNSAPCKVKKILLQKCRNNVKENEEFIFCRVCNRKWHKVCANYLEEIAKEAFTCPSCVREKSIAIRPNVFKSKSLPHNNLSRFLENRVNTYLKEIDPSINEVVIRVLSSSDKVVEVKPGMKSHYCETCEMPETFKYRLKAIFAFQEIDCQEVCFFGLHVQEYGSDCPDPNSRRVYVAYLDSLHFFRPRKYRTDVYHEFLLGYLEYVKKLGFTMAHIWACPPGEGDDYIFHMHPPEQRLPKPKRLQEWYIKLLDKAMKENIVVDYKDIFSDALHSNMLSPTELPYFDGDYWPNALEEIFKEIDDECTKMRSLSDPTSCQDTESTIKREIIFKNQVSKMDKKPKKRKQKNPHLTNCKRKRSCSSDSVQDVSRRVLELMEKRKENFFVIRLHSQTEASTLPATEDPDPVTTSDLMDGRDKFLCLARERHLEFSSMRRARFSTLVFCYELHQEQKGALVSACNSCGNQSEVRYVCHECEDFELCPACEAATSHCHPLTRSDRDRSPSRLAAAPAADLQDTFRARMVRYSASLQHACHCRDANCRTNFCAKMKAMLKHSACCRTAPRTACNLCQSFLRICFVHAKFCADARCPVPSCLGYRSAWRQQGSQQRMQQAQLLRRRVAIMQSQQQQAAMTTVLSTAEDSKATATPPPRAANEVADVAVAEDDLRLVCQQYNHFIRSLPFRDDFQKHTLCSTTTP